MAIAQPAKETIGKPQDEYILVVKRNDLFSMHQPWNGLKQEPLDMVMQTIKAKKKFLPRSLMENDLMYKQIIPYLVFTHHDKYFLMQRQAKASEQRLKNKFSLGIGGHIRQEDMTTDSIFDWAHREFHEEVSYHGAIKIKTLGVLNDDSNAVGKVHIGLVLLAEGDIAHISVKSELKSGQLFTLHEIEPFFERMETWSQMVFTFLKKNHPERAC